MSELKTYIANTAYQIAKLRKERDLVKAQISLMEFLEEKKTREYKQQSKKLRTLEGSLVSLSLDYVLAKDIDEAF